MRALFLGVVVVFCLVSCVAGEWPMLGHDLSHTGYVDLNQSFGDSSVVLKWAFEVNNSIRAQAVAADLNGDGLLEVLFPAGSTLYALSSSGGLLWFYGVNGVIRTTPSVGDLDFDGRREIVFGADDGILYCLKDDGTTLWSFPTNGSIVTSPALADLNEDNRLEVYFGSWDENFYSLDYDGKELWRYRIGEKMESSPALADINNDNESEIIFGCNNNVLYALSSPPYKVWMYPTSGNIVAAPTVVDLNKDGRNEIIFGAEDGILYVLNYAVYRSDCGVEMSRLSLLWNYTSGRPFKFAAAAGDLDSDSRGRLEVVVGSDDKMLYILNYTGGRVYRYTVNKPVRSMPLLVDFTGDGSPEIVFAADDKTVYMINRTGSTLWTFNAGSIVRSSPIAADLDLDGSFELMFGSDGGMLYAFQSMAAYKKSLGDGLYRSAEGRYLLNDFNLSRSYAVEAMDVYTGIDYQEGVSKVGRLLDKVSAMELCILAQEAYALGDLEKAITFALESDRVYYGLNLGNVSVCSMLLVKSNADLYLLEAEYFYGNGDYNESVVYANEAKKIYRTLNNTKALDKIDLLVDRANIALNADELYGKASGYYSNGSYGIAQDYVNEALALYFGLEDGERVNDSLSLGKSINASLDLKRAESYYNKSMLAEASVLALEAYRLYGEVNDTKGLESATGVINRTQDYVRARELLSKSMACYANGSLDNASNYAHEALSMCLKTNDGECIQVANMVLGNVEGNPIRTVTPFRAGVLLFTAFLLLSAVVLRYAMRRK